MLQFKQQNLPDLIKEVQKVKIYNATSTGFKSLLRFRSVLFWLIVVWAT